ncbi:hypothetical protein SPBR_07495 [Sporothrix brasiliensis 5110]|uniref:Uncharacterized protein n=1 Tax=Sporothrix brasiliensis 5110 TaxID=1398154 RepID=A0A0C2FF21_9PEZI|nr:uncharacterized protein SPBR_07495 [Sporothrix brasiliensis 5110]KIH89693.1 hypothetical protein SPBR_07495 [Sporothrix brasiliensis 5110]
MAAVDLAGYRDRWNQLVTYSYTGSVADKANLDSSPLNPNFEGTTHATAAGDTGSRTHRSSSHSCTDVHDVNDMFVGPFLDCLRNNRIEPMVRLWQQTCPGDKLGGYGPLLHGFMGRCVRTNSLTPFQNEEDADKDTSIFYWNLTSILQYRWTMAMLAQDILASMGLAPPGRASCLFWDRRTWEKETPRAFGVTESDFEDRHTAVWHVFNQERSPQEQNLIALIEPAPEQGPTFYRFIFYITAGIVEALYRNPTGESDIEIQDRMESMGQAAAAEMDSIGEVIPTEMSCMYRSRGTVTSKSPLASKRHQDLTVGLRNFEAKVIVPVNDAATVLLDEVVAVYQRRDVVADI